MHLLTTKPDTPKSHKLLLLGLFLLGYCSGAEAKDYQVEAVVFAHNQSHRAFESTHYIPVREVSSEAPTWALEASMLLEEANTIRNANDYQIVAHYSWGQEALPSSEAAVFSVAESSLQGWFKIYASHLLFANIDLDFNGYRMSEKRRLKLNENHYFDHPKFGILLRVSRLAKPDTEETDDR